MVLNNEEFFHYCDTVKKDKSYNIRIESTWKKENFDFPSLRDKPDQIFLPRSWAGKIHIKITIA